MYMHHWQACLISFFSEIVILFSGRLQFFVDVNRIFTWDFFHSVLSLGESGGRWIASTPSKAFEGLNDSHDWFFPVKSRIFVLRVLQDQWIDLQR